MAIKFGRMILPAALLLATFLLFTTGALRAQEAFHLQEATIDQVHAAFKEKRLTCRALVGHYLKRIEAYNLVGPQLNAVQTANPRVLDAADRLDAAYRANGPVGPLHCIPVLVKDQVETADMPTSYKDGSLFVSKRAGMTWA